MRAAALLFAALVALGCSGKPVVPAKQPEPEAPTEPRHVATGAVEITARGEDRMRRWNVRAKSSELAFEGEGAVSGGLDQVEGELFVDDGVASRFRALSGEADQAKQELTLSGEVEITAEKEKAVLTAQEVKWIEELGLIEASGDVRMKSPEYVAGPFAKLWATPDLTDVGTPDMFKGWKRK